MNAAGLFLSTPLPIGLLMAPPDALAPVVLLKLRLMYLAEMIWRLCVGSAIEMASPWLT